MAIGEAILACPQAYDIIRTLAAADTEGVEDEYMTPSSRCTAQSPQNHRRRRSSLPCGPAWSESDHGRNLEAPRPEIRGAWNVGNNGGIQMSQGLPCARRLHESPDPTRNMGRLPPIFRR